MRHIRTTWILIVISAVTCGAAQREPGQPSSDGRFYGTWTGTWEGAGSGGLELVVETRNGGTPGGSISITGEQPYKATLKAVSFEGDTLTVRYDFPADESVEVVLAAAVEGSHATGTWTARQTGSETEMAAGTWKATKK